MANEQRLIDANVVLAKQLTTGLSDTSGNYYGYADVVFVNDIENAPTVDAVPVVHGRWEVKRMADIKMVEVKCSACAWLDVDTYDAVINYSAFSYCPNCGAKMDGGNTECKSIH